MSIGDQLNRLDDKIIEHDQIITSLKQQIENMKCCGNCEFRSCAVDSERSIETCTNGFIKGSLFVCQGDWQSDNLTREEREK